MAGPHQQLTIKLISEKNKLSVLPVIKPFTVEAIFLSALDEGLLK